MDVAAPALNPWLSMWTQPRATIQQIIDTNPERLVLLLAALSGCSQALDRASMQNMGDNMAWPTICLIAATLGAVTGIIGLYIGGALIRWTGSWLGGQATSQSVRAALAWASVPVIWALLLWIPELAIFGQEMFTSETPVLAQSPSKALVLMGFGLVQIVIGIWAIVVMLKCIGQVQGFSAWKALGNLVLAALLLTVPVLVLLLVLAI